MPAHRLILRTPVGQLITHAVKSDPALIVILGLSDHSLIASTAAGLAATFAISLYHLTVKLGVPDLSFSMLTHPGIGNCSNVVPHAYACISLKRCRCHFAECVPLLHLQPAGIAALDRLLNASQCV